MPHWLGVDIGTSGVKAVVTDGDGRVLAQATAPLTVSRPRPRWSEQDPGAWLVAANAAVQDLPEAVRAGVAGLGLTGQMHGAVLLDAADRPLRPAILWNDGRAEAACRALELQGLAELTGNPVLPGFTAPKLAWVRTHEPETFAATTRVLLPKDFVRLAWTGEAATDLSDAAGTLWLDVAARAWSPRALALTRLEPGHMPRLLEGTVVSGSLRPATAAELGLPAGIPVAAGAGDNAAGALSMGVLAQGGMLSLGTSGVIFLADLGHLPDPGKAVHAFCHCLPGVWHRMAVILSAASCLDWAAASLGFADVPALLAAAEMAGPAPAGLLFLPHLSGERTPLNDAAARGAWLGMTHATGRGDLARAVLEGVALALADAAEPLHLTPTVGARGGFGGRPALGADVAPVDLSLIGGGARSRLWAQLIADATGLTLTHRSGGEVGPALGAAYLARIAATGVPPDEACPQPPALWTVTPASPLDLRVSRLEEFRRATARLGPQFREIPHA